MWHPFVRDTEVCPPLCTRRDVQFLLPINTINFNVPTEGGLDKRDFGGCNKVVAIPLKACVRFDINDDKQITRRCPVYTDFAFAS